MDVYTGNRDTDEYFLKSLDDESLIRACSVNKHYREKCNENFFKNIIQKKHSYWEKWLPKYNNSYKTLFLKCVAYVAKIYEEFKVPYLDNVLSPEEFYKKYRFSSYNLYRELRRLAYEQNREDVLEILNSVFKDKHINLNSSIE